MKTARLSPSSQPNVSCAKPHGARRKTSSILPIALLLLNLGVGDVSAQLFPATFNVSALNGSNGFVVPGLAAGDEASIVSAAGDVDGDGIDDFLIGAPEIAPSGLTFVVAGRTNGFGASFDLASLDGTNGFCVRGGTLGGRAGRVLSRAGDFNSDGFDDFLVGAPVISSLAYLVFGEARPRPKELNLATLETGQGVRFTPINGFDELGTSLAEAGDLNGDGLPDIAFGTPRANPGSGEFAGSSYVVFGRASAIGTNLSVSSLNGINGFVIGGAQPNDNSAASLGRGGDVNGDGLDDLLIGAPLVDPSAGSDAGATYVLFGSPTGFAPNVNLSTLTGSSGFRISGATANGRLGGALQGCGDFNGDGFGDVILGEPTADFAALNAGAAYVLFGFSNAGLADVDVGALNGTNGFRLDGEAAGDAAGTWVSSAGDVNGDGLSDVLIGAPQADISGATDSGACYLIYGRRLAGSATFSLSSVNGINGARFVSTNSQEAFGITASPAGDVNGDGAPDLIVGSRADTAGLDAGAAYVMFGGDVFAPEIPAALSTDEDTPLTFVGARDALDPNPTLVTLSSTNGSLTLSNNVATYTPPADFFGTNVVRFATADRSGNAATGQVSIAVLPVNDPPVIAQGAGPLPFPVSSGDSQPPPTVGPALSATDVDSDAGQLVWTVAVPPAHGIATVSGTGAAPATFTYQWTFLSNTNDAFTVRVSDGAASDTVAFAVNVTVSTGTGGGTGTTTAASTGGGPGGSATGGGSGETVRVFATLVPATRCPNRIGQFNVVRDPSSGGSLTVGYSLSGTATNGIDYETLPGFVTFAPGEASAPIIVRGIDTLEPATELIQITLLPGSGFNVGSPDSAAMPLSPTVADDFNKDCQPDLLWQQGRDVGIFYMRGTDRIGDSGPALALDRRERIVGTGDFNLDAFTDVVRQTGRKISLQLLSNQVELTEIPLASVPKGWKVKSVIELGGDFTRDLVIQRGGRLRQLILSGTTVAQEIKDPNAVNSVAVVASGDFDGANGEDIYKQFGRQLRVRRNNGANEYPPPFELVLNLMRGERIVARGSFEGRASNRLDLATQRGRAVSAYQHNGTTLELGPEMFQTEPKQKIVGPR